MHELTDEKLRGLIKRLARSRTPESLRSSSPASKPSRSMQSRRRSPPRRSLRSLSCQFPRLTG